MAAFGLDIGSFQVKALQVEPTKEGFKLIHYAHQSLAGKDLAGVIKETVKTAGIKPGDEVNLALQESDVYTRIIQVPKLSEAELASSLPYEAEQYVPVPLDQVELYHQVLSDDNLEAKTMRVVLIAVTKERLNRLTALIDQAGLIPKSLETELFCLQRLFVDRGKTQLILHLGHNSSDMMIMDKGSCLFLYSLASGSLALTKVLMNELSLSEAQAEEYKKTYGLRTDLLEGKVALLLSPLIDAVIDQINKAIIFLNQQGFNKKLDQVVVTGGGAQLPGLTGYLVAKLNNEVVSGDPFTRFIKDEAFKKLIAGETNPQLSTVTGLALKGLI